MRPTRLLIADDHTLIREGLKKLFEETDEFVVVAEAATGDEALDRIDSGDIDLAILDLKMPGISGAELITCVREHHPTLPIMILSMEDRPTLVQEALAAGATGYLTKHHEPEVLFTALARLAEGKRFLDPKIAEEIAFDAISRASHQSHTRLTPREHEIFRLLAAGTAVKDIAVLLGIKSRTVSAHKSRLMARMGFSSTADLVRYADRRRINRK